TPTSRLAAAPCMTGLARRSTRCRPRRDRVTTRSGSALCEGRMARSVPADLEDALSANPAARASFGAMSSKQKDAWIAWIERPRFARARRRRVADAVHRIGGGVAVRETEVVAPAAVALPRDDWWVWLLGLALLAGLA